MALPVGACPSSAPPNQQNTEFRIHNTQSLEYIQAQSTEYRILTTQSLECIQAQPTEYRMHPVQRDNTQSLEHFEAQFRVCGTEKPNQRHQQNTFKVHNTEY